jgi:hypothetical protein
MPAVGSRNNYVAGEVGTGRQDLPLISSGVGFPGSVSIFALDVPPCDTVRFNEKPVSLDLSFLKLSSLTCLNPHMPVKAVAAA